MIVTSDQLCYLAILLVNPEEKYNSSIIRIQGSEYSVASDIWSLGLSLLEVSLGVFPLPPPDGAQMVRIFGEKIAQDPVVIAASQRTPRSAAAYSSGEGEH